MPYKVATDAEGCSGFAVIKPETGEVVACHANKADAAKHVRALYANVPDAIKKAKTESLLALQQKIQAGQIDANSLAAHHYITTELTQRGLDLTGGELFEKEVIIDPDLTLDGVELEELFDGEEELVEDIIVKWEEGEIDFFKVAFGLWGDGLEILVNPTKEDVDKVAESDTFTPPASVATDAKRALEWIKEGKAGGGFTDVGRARAAQLAGRRPVTLRTIKRMRSFFARHEVDKKAEGFHQGEKNYPSGGRVAWDAWGGDSGFSWVKGILRGVDKSLEKHLQGKHDQKSHSGKFARGIADEINAGGSPTVGEKDVGPLFSGLAKLEDHPDITELRVENSMLFGGEGLGIARKDMPQVPSDRRDEFLSDLAKGGTKTTKDSIDPKILKPVQKEVSGSRSGAIYEKYKASGGVVPDEQRILISSDGYVIDGHHTWAAAVALGFDDPSAKLPVFRIDLPAKEALSAATKWSDDKGIGRRALDSTSKSRWYEEPFLKADDKKFTLGPLYIPNLLDAHSEWTDEEELQKAVWEYVRSGDRNIRLQHNRDVVAGEWVEMMTFPYELKIPVKKSNGDDGEFTYPANTVFMGVLWKDWAWELVKSGKLRGYSIGGKAKRVGADLPDETEKGQPSVSAVHVDTIMKPSRRKVKKAKDVEVGDIVLYSVSKPEGTTYATAQVERIETSGKVTLRGTQESEEATEDDPIAVLRVWAETDSGYEETDRRVLKPFSALRLTDKDVEKSTESKLQEKAKEHNEAVGDAKGKRTTAGVLLQVYRRGVGAYKTNPSSVRPNVTGREQWAMGRVNGFLHALRNGRFKRGAYDTDLLPDAHPLSSKGKK
jgi:hypothetical protein